MDEHCTLSQRREAHSLASSTGLSVIYKHCRHPLGKQQLKLNKEEVVCSIFWNNPQPVWLPSLLIDLHQSKGDSANCSDLSSEGAGQIFWGSVLWHARLCKYKCLVVAAMWGQRWLWEPLLHILSALEKWALSSFLSSKWVLIKPCYQTVKSERPRELVCLSTSCPPLLSSFNTWCLSRKFQASLQMGTCHGTSQRAVFLVSQQARYSFLSQCWLSIQGCWYKRCTMMTDDGKVRVPVLSQWYSRL